MSVSTSTSKHGGEESEKKETTENEEEDSMQANMEAAEKELKHMLLIRMGSEMKFDEMNVSRRPPDAASDQTISSLDTKIASLEPIVEDEELLEEENDESKTCNNALLNYFATLGETGNNDNIDLHFLDVLCEKADLNIQDMHGQTIFHEVARDWSTDIAIYLLAKGAQCDVADHYGRTPLFAAAASNHTEMIIWLVEVGADLNHKTMKGEEQLPIHYAAKYGAIAAFNLLVKLGANPLARDGIGRTPFYLAAAAGKRNICEYFLYKEFPVVSFTRSANSTIDQIIENLPSILVQKALNQFIVESKRGMVTKYCFHLNCLGKRRWRLINKSNPETNNLVHRLPLDPLDRIIRRNDLSLINHPLILELLKLKSERYGNKWSRINVALTILFTILWTTSASIRVNEMEDLNAPPVDQLTRDVVLALTVIAQCFTFMFIFKAFYEWKTLRKMEAKENERGKRECEESVPFCHPRWVSDISLLEKRLKGIDSIGGQFWSKDGIAVEIICLIACTVYFVLTLAWYNFESTEPIRWLRETRMIYSILFVMILFLRLNGCFHAYQSLGLFVTMIGKIPIAGFQIMFLFFEFFIPFSVSFWVTFGGSIIQKNAEFQTFQNLLYQLWLMSFVGDFKYNALSNVNDFLAELFVSLYFILVAIITINIYVAFLTEVFAAVSQEATEKAYMAEARFCQSIELIFPNYKYELEKYLNEHCAPMVMEKDLFVSLYKNDEGKNPRAKLRSVRRELTELNADVKVLLATEETALRNSKIVVKKVEEVNESYDEANIKELHRFIRKIMTEQKRPIVKGINIATNKIIELIGHAGDLF